MMKAERAMNRRGVVLRFRRFAMNRLMLLIVGGMVLAIVAILFLLPSQPTGGGSRGDDGSLSWPSPEAGGPGGT